MQTLSKPAIAADISFSYNWNKKLYCRFFTTIRLANYAKYHVGKLYRIMHKENYAFDGLIVRIEYYKLQELPELVCMMDTGLTKQETIELIQKMYVNKNIDWSSQLLSVLLIENAQWDKP